MVKLQNEMNSVINEDWIHKGWDFLRAAAIESCEAIEHHGWKWWKHQSKDLKQLQMEIVDIWHFILSTKIVDNNGNLNKTSDEIFLSLEQLSDTITFGDKTYNLAEMNLLSKLDLLVGLFCFKKIELNLFISILLECGLDENELYSQYIQKNVLNIFRQNNGYKDGSYIKIWNNEEDNVHLVRIAKTIDIDSPMYSRKIYEKLEETYKTLK